MYNYKYCIIMYIYLLLLYILAVKRISEENDY